jgi:magnesium-transporting ATPase (P-type)
VATLIAIVVFTVPDGNDQLKGSPIFLEYNWFTIFFVSDSIALLSSTTSILIFLSILTSSYSKHEFFPSLTKRLVLWLTMLFISIVAMVVAFNATCFLVYKKKKKKKEKKAIIPSVTILLAYIPILCSILLHCRLFFDITHSTLWSRYLFQSGRHKIF